MWNRKLRRIPVGNPSGVFHESAYFPLVPPGSTLEASVKLNFRQQVGKGNEQERACRKREGGAGQVILQIVFNGPACQRVDQSPHCNHASEADLDRYAAALNKILKT